MMDKYRLTRKIILNAHAVLLFVIVIVSFVVEKLR